MICNFFGSMLYFRIMNRGKPQKYLSLSEEILALARELSLREGDALPSERCLSERFGCNHLTVRKALRVLAERNRIHRVPSRGSYFGPAPAPLRSSNRIGFIFPDDEIFYYRIFASVERVIASRGMHPVVHLTGGSEMRELELLDYFDCSGTLALIAVPNRLCADRYRKLNIPTLFFDTRLPDLDIPQVITDDSAGAFAATEQLILRGHIRIAHIGNEYDFTGEQRLNGFLDALRKHGLRPDRSLIRMRYPSREWGYHAARELFALPRPPTAVFCSNDTIASGVVNFCADKSLRIPADLSVVGFGNTQTAEYLNLSSVSQNTGRITGAICSNLELLLKGGRVPPLTVIPTSCISRASVADCAKPSRGRGRT